MTALPVLAALPAIALAGLAAAGLRRHGADLHDLSTDVNVAFTALAGVAGLVTAVTLIVLALTG